MDRPVTHAEVYRRMVGHSNAFARDAQTLRKRMHSAAKFLTIQNFLQPGNQLKTKF
jgi:hypothetical protein